MSNNEDQCHEFSRFAELMNRLIYCCYYTRQSINIKLK
jgi:hypothetical protein